MGIEFCHIAPTAHLDLCRGRSTHLVLAHLVETDQSYVDFYVNEKRENLQTKIVLDNSAFEMYKQGRPMYDPNKLIEMGTKVGADYIVMSDYPGEKGEKTIESARALAPQFKRAGFGTFFVPQSEIGDEKDVINGFRWASNNPDLVDYIGVSILTAPNAYGVEKSNKLQRFVSRMKLLYSMKETTIFSNIKDNKQKVHLLGMVDGPNEIMYLSPFARYIDTWDSSAAVWAGLNGILFDNSPTGLIDGKFEKEVDFNFRCTDNDKIELAKRNINYIDKMCYGYLWS